MTEGSGAGGAAGTAGTAAAVPLPCSDVRAAFPRKAHPPRPIEQPSARRAPGVASSMPRGDHVL